MKTILTLILALLAPLLVRGANPSFQSFDQLWFNTNSYIISGDTNRIMSWPAVNTNFLTTNGYVLGVNTGALASAIGSTTNHWQINNATNVYRSAGFVGIGTATPMYRVHIDAGSTVFPQFVMTNNSLASASIQAGVSASVASFVVSSGSSSGGSYSLFSGFSEASFAMNTLNNTSGQRYVRYLNSNNRLILQCLTDDASGLISTPFIITNTAPNNSLIIGLDGIARFYASGGGINTHSLRIGGTASSGLITNMLTGSATLDFGSGSLGVTEDLPITVTGASSGDVVRIGVPQVSATGILGSWSGFASNNTVFVRFTPTAAAQDPASGTYRVVVEKW